MTDESFPHVFHYGVGERRIRAKLGGPLRVFTEDCFSGKLVAVEGKPREAAPEARRRRHRCGLRPPP
jgi:hypothetical protein